MPPKSALPRLICLAVGLVASVVTAQGQNNDNFANRIDLGSGTSFTTTSASLTTATMEPTEPMLGTYNKSIWYSWTAPENLTVNVSYAASTLNFTNNDIIVFIGNGLSTLNRVCYSDGGSVATFPAVKGTTYQIGFFGGFTNERGNVILSMTSAPFAAVTRVAGPDTPTSSAPTNDNFAQRKNLGALPLTLVTYHYGATAEAFDPGSQSLWYSFTAESNQTLTIASEYNTDINSRTNLYQGSAVDRLIPVASGSNSSPLIATIVKGTTYQLCVSNVTGNIYYARRRLVLSAANIDIAGDVVAPAEPTGTAPRNDFFLNRQVLSGPRVTAVAYTGTATTEPLESSNGNATVWYSWTAAADGTASISLGGDSISKSATVYTGVELASLVRVGQTTNNTFSFTVRGGTQYTIALGTSSTSGGTLTLTIAGPGVVFPSPDNSNPRLVNIATRGLVGTGGDIMFGGFSLSGTRRVLVRAVGPTLGNFGVSGTLADPKLEVYQGSNLLTSNDNWGSGIDAALIPSAASSVGAFPLTAGSKDAAIIATLLAGGYTVQVSGVGNTTGVAIIEVYELP